MSVLNLALEYHSLPSPKKRITIENDRPLRKAHDLTIVVDYVFMSYHTSTAARQSVE